jgi:hypothetical protein
MLLVVEERRDPMGVLRGGCRRERRGEEVVMTRREGMSGPGGFGKRVSIFRKQRRYEENPTTRGAAVGRTAEGLRYIMWYSGIPVF